MPKYHVDRSIEINATPQKVFDVVSDFNTWQTWSPWLIAEPEANVTVSDNSNSVGSLYSWKGQVTGEGELEHKHLDPGRLIDCEIRFAKPFKSVAGVSFDIEECSDGTKLTWNMNGSLPWFMFWMKSMMQAMIGMDYSRGLCMLKEWIETGNIQSKTNINGIKPIEALRVVGVFRSTEMKNIGEAMDSAYAETDTKFAAAGLPTDGDMVSVYTNFNMKTQVMDFIAGYAVPASAAFSDDSLRDWSTAAGDAFNVEHIGCYGHLGNAWAAANQHVHYKKLKQRKGGAYEIYRNTPQDTEPKDLVTDIYLPLR